MAPHLDAINQAVSSSDNELTERELAYIKAIKAYASGSLFNFAEELVIMLYDYPLGMLVAMIVDLPTKTCTIFWDICMKTLLYMCNKL